jgi:hypothetical protein
MLNLEVVTVSSATSFSAPGEFVELCSRSSEILWQIAVDKSELNDSVGTLACATGSDLIRFQGVLWESLVVNAGIPSRKYFQLGENLAQSLALLNFASHSTIGQALVALRAEMGTLLDEVGVSDFLASMPDASVFEKINFPDLATIESDVVHRLDGQTPQVYSHRRKQEALKLSVQSFTAQSSGDVDEAIRLMFASDFTFLDAYLVESAHAAGDRNLFTARTRWELASYSTSLITELPHDLPVAAAMVRSALTDLLGAQDVARLTSLLPAV